LDKTDHINVLWWNDGYNRKVGAKIWRVGRILVLFYPDKGARLKILVSKDSKKTLYPPQHYLECSNSLALVNLKCDKLLNRIMSIPSPRPAQLSKSRLLANSLRYREVIKSCI